MIPPLIAIDILTLLYAGYCWYRVRKAYRSRDYMTGQLVESTRTFSRTKHALEAQIDLLQKRAEKAETDRDLAAAEAQYKDKQVTDLCRFYKKLQVDLQDKTVQYNNLVLKHNSLLDKMPKDGDMPI